MLVTTKPVYSVDNRLKFLAVCIGFHWCIAVMRELDIEIKRCVENTFDFDC